MAAKKEADLPVEVNAALPANADFDMEQYAGVGLEDVTAADLATPFFRLLQGLSPETKPSDPGYVPGAAEGRWLDVIGKQVYDSILFTPVRYVTHFIEWKPRSAGGGLVANHGPDRSIKQRYPADPATGRMMTPEGNEIIETHIYYGVVVSGTIGNETTLLAKEAVISFAGTQSKVSRKWITGFAQLKLPRPDGTLYTPAMFASTYKLASTPTKNNKGSWALATVTPVGWTKDIPEAAMLIPQMVAFAKVSAEMQPGSLVDAGDAGTASTVGGSATLDSDIPF